MSYSAVSYNLTKKERFEGLEVSQKKTIKKNNKNNGKGLKMSKFFCNIKGATEQNKVDFIELLGATVESYEVSSLINMQRLNVKFYCKEAKQVNTIYSAFSRVDYIKFNSTIQGGSNE